MEERTKCKHCGDELYLIERVFTSHRQELYVVYCSGYKCELLPVIVTGFCQEEDFYRKCKAVWDEANFTPKPEPLSVLLMKHLKENGT